VTDFNQSENPSVKKYLIACPIFFSPGKKVKAENKFIQ
jgi:hypothetical protein